MIKIINFDILDPSPITEKVYDFDLDYEYASEVISGQKNDTLNFKLFELGFETMNPIINSGPFLALMVIMSVPMALVLVIKLYFVY